MPEPMPSSLDSLLAALGERPPDPRLETLEPLVWSRIAMRAREPVPANQWAWRAALAALIMSAGALTASGAAANAAPDVSPFAIHSAFAPSTLLGDRR